MLQELRQWTGCCSFRLKVSALLISMLNIVISAGRVPLLPVSALEIIESYREPGYAPSITRSVGGALMRMRGRCRCRAALSCPLGSRRALRSVRLRSTGTNPHGVFLKWQRKRRAPLELQLQQLKGSGSRRVMTFLLRDVIARNPFEDPTLWDAVVIALNEATRKGFTLRAVKDRLKLLLKLFKAGDRINLRK